jgi:hypothetical protein
MTSRPGFWAAIDGSGNGQVVLPIDDFLLAGALAEALLIGCRNPA